MADFCKACSNDMFGPEITSLLDYGCAEDEVTLIICEGCGRNVWVKKDGTRVECNTCIYPDSSVCTNCKGIEGQITEIAGDGSCGNWEERKI